MLHNLVFIVSAIATNNEPLAYTPTRSYFTHAQRFEQSLATIESVRRYVPDAYIVFIEGTPIVEEMRAGLCAKVDYMHLAYLDEEVSACVNGQHKGMGEASSIGSYLQSAHFRELRPSLKSLGKISGRYTIQKGFNWDLKDNGIVCNIHTDNPHHWTRTHMSTMFYTVGSAAIDSYIEAVHQCIRHPELATGVALEHILALCLKEKNITFYRKTPMNVGGEYGPWGGFVMH